MQGGWNRQKRGVGARAMLQQGSPCVLAASAAPPILVGGLAPPTPPWLATPWLAAPAPNPFAAPQLLLSLHWVNLPQLPFFPQPQPQPFDSKMVLTRRGEAASASEQSMGGRR